MSVGLEVKVRDIEENCLSEIAITNNIFVGSQL